MEENLPIDIPPGMTYAGYRLQVNSDIDAAIARTRRAFTKEGTITVREAYIPPIDKASVFTSFAGLRTAYTETMSPNHPGWDMQTLEYIAAPAVADNAHVVAMTSGRVIFKGFYSKELGYTVITMNRWGELNGYGHLEKNSYDALRVDDEVVQGQILARVGNSGNATPNRITGERNHVLHFWRKVLPDMNDPLLMAQIPNLPGLQLVSTQRPQTADAPPLTRSDLAAAGFVFNPPAEDDPADHFKSYKLAYPIFDGQLPKRDIVIQPAAEIIASAPERLQDVRMKQAFQQFVAYTSTPPTPVAEPAATSYRTSQPTTQGITGSR